MRNFSGRELHLISVHLDGPWPCEACGQMSQFAEVKTDVNRIFCKNETCGYVRLIDKVRHRIVENDGTHWRYDPSNGQKWRIKA